MTTIKYGAKNIYASLTTEEFLAFVCKLEVDDEGNVLSITQINTQCRIGSDTVAPQKLAGQKLGSYHFSHYIIKDTLDELITDIFASWRNDLDIHIQQLETEYASTVKAVIGAL